MAVESQAEPAPARVPFYNDPKIRSLVYQVALIAIVVGSNRLVERRYAEVFR